MTRIGRVTASDRASAGVYADESGPAIEAAVAPMIADAEWHVRLVPDDPEAISAALRELVDEAACELVLTTGGTGPTRRDITPEATRAVIEKELPGFGEIQRMRTFDIAPTSILSRATAGIRGRSLIVNLPGRPSAVRECLEVLAPAIRKCLELLRADSTP
ncbi:MAG: molybdopterin adenylyltransferase [Terrimicrobiaceae bacterium]|nr:molybdopterin adenylyltransferase [Terrimicrobiaceae bacterium]